MAGSDVDGQIAVALARHREEILDQTRTDTDHSLRALLDAFSHGRWGSFWCLFEDPTATLRRLTELAILVAPYLLQLPQAASLVGRLLQVTGDMATLIAAGERTARQTEMHQLRELLEIKDDFLHQVVHDLRRPLGVARGYISMIADGSLSDSVAVAKGSAAASTALKEMVALLDGLASIARLDDKAEMLQRAPCYVHTLVTAAADSVQAEAATKAIKLQVDADPDLQLSVDAARLGIAMTNLLENAVKYAPPESVVAVETRGRARAVSISVTDQGPGIEPAEMVHVFEKHRRGAAQADSSGLGLGLHIARRMVELHGGQLTLKSMPGQGSTFTILLPH